MLLASNFAVLELWFMNTIGNEMRYQVTTWGHTLLLKTPFLISSMYSELSNKQECYVSYWSTRAPPRCAAMLPKQLIPSATHFVTVGRDMMVQQFSVGWAVWGSIPGGGEIFCTGPDRL
jgi:hypothetical protein